MLTTLICLCNFKGTLRAGIQMFNSLNRQPNNEQEGGREQGELYIFKNATLYFIKHT